MTTIFSFFIAPESAPSRFGKSRQEKTVVYADNS